MTECPNCARVRGILQQAMKAIDRMAGGLVAELKKLIEEALKCAP